MSFVMTSEQEKVAAELFACAPDKREGKTRLTIRFNPNTHRLYYPTYGEGKRKQYQPHRSAYLVRYVEQPGAQTPSGGRYTRKSLTVRTKDGRKWYGNVKKGTDTVKLRLAPTPKEDETD